MKSLKETELPLFKGNEITELPDDLFIPPDALEIFLDDFSGPMDLLLYLINKKDIDILELDVSEITDQYIRYIDFMDVLKVELASDYMVMAATLAHVKSRMLLPIESEEEDEEDPRSALIKRLQEYQRFRTAAENLSIMPRIDRDFFPAQASNPDFTNKETKTHLVVDDLLNAYIDAASRPRFGDDHIIDFEQLSTQERIEIILEILSRRNIVQFFKTYKASEGEQGVIVSLLASLELAKNGNLEIIQSDESNQFYLKSIKKKASTNERAH